MTAMVSGVSLCPRRGTMKMIVTWDKTSQNVWFGKWARDASSVDLYLVVEELPASNNWDWAVWQAGAATILDRGIAASAREAAEAAESAAARHWSAHGGAAGIC
jgi:hypothetical protein